MDSEHFKNHGMSPTLIVKLRYQTPLVEVYCAFCRQPVGKERSTTLFLSPSLVKKLSKHFLDCLAEPAEGWSDEAGRLIEHFLLKHLFSKPRDRLRISLNLLQAETK
ncbi:MAG: hypothetical protein QXX19_06720 [Candidatus Caldarchaeum sp.]